MVLLLIGQVRGGEEAEGPNPEPVVAPNGPRPEPGPEPGTGPVAMVGSNPKIWFEHFFVDVGKDYCN